MNSFKSFETRVYGKWILAGEHAVLRGVPALVFPLFSRALEFSYMPSQNKSLTLKLSGDYGKELELLVWGVLEKACEMTHIQRSDITGELRISSTIPIGAGLGASAALCVAYGLWFAANGLITQNQIYEFSRQLENLFHGESSGVDIAVALSAEGLRFERNGERKNLKPLWTPLWFVSYSDKRGVTADCVNKVKALIEKNKEMGQKLDQEMQDAVHLCEVALQSEERHGLPLLIQGVEKAGLVFEKWGLTQGPVYEHIQKLKDAGAIAVKPTGSGDGGFVLSLWQVPPPKDVEGMLIPCF